jgi:hypothetical protein
VKYQPGNALTLTAWCESITGTVAGGQFDWGGRLRKCNGGAQRLAQAEWKPAAECKGTSQLDCKADAPSRDESRT